MRALVAGLALVALAACGGDSSTARPSDSVAGTWTLQTYNGKPLPFTGNPNDDGSVDRVNGGTLGFDGKATYVLGIKIVKQFAGRHALHGSLRAHGHKHRRLDRAVRGVQESCPGARVGASRLNLEVQSLLLQSR